MFYEVVENILELTGRRDAGERVLFSPRRLDRGRDASPEWVWGDYFPQILGYNDDVNQETNTCVCRFRFVKCVGSGE